jgi:hypothetical protein
MLVTRDRLILVERRALVSAATAIVALAYSMTASAQDDQVQHRLPEFQAPASDSLESEMMSRLPQPGHYEPGDLSRLARLAVLESISMLVNVRADLRGTIAGNQLDQEITTLWNDSQAFYEFVSTSPYDDAASVARAGAMLAFVDADYRQVQGSLATLGGLSVRAAADFKSLSRLLGDVNSIMGTLEANAAIQNLPAEQAPPRLGSLRGEAQIAANLVVALIGKAESVPRGRPGRDAFITDLTDLLDRLQGFCRLLSVDPPNAEILDSFRDARRQMWRTESRLLHLEWRAGLESPWRLVRERMNGISDALGLPRVIVSAPVLGRLSSADRSLAAHVDHTVAWLDEYLSQNAASLRKTEAGAEFEADATRLRHDLLGLRRRALGNLPTDGLAASVREIVRLNENLSERAVQLSNNKAGKPSTVQYKDTAAAVRELGSFVAKR